MFQKYYHPDFSAPLLLCAYFPTTNVAVFQADENNYIVAMYPQFYGGNSVEWGCAMRNVPTFARATEIEYKHFLTKFNNL